jgi:transposase
VSGGRQQAGAGRGVTMRDVADRAGVGLATVSRVVNGARYEGSARHSVVPTRYVARGSGEIAAPAG